MGGAKRVCNDWISIRDLNVWYGQNHIIKSLTVDFPTCHLTSIIGPSGCGKTTLLRSFNRFLDLDPESKVFGEIRWRGQNILDEKTDVIELRTHVGMLAQRPIPLPMSIFDNVAYGPRLHGQHDLGELERIVKEKLEMADLWDEVKDRLSAPASDLSIGQQQRLCLARTLSVEPDIILADEPTSALDPIATERIEELLLKLKKRYTIILATHNIHQARKVSDYVAHLYFGELVEAGWARELFDAPRHPRTHAYIHGKNYTEHAIDQELVLKSHPISSYYRSVCKSLESMNPGKVLRIIIPDRIRAGRLATAIKEDGNDLIRVRKLNKTEWEILVKKAG